MLRIKEKFVLSLSVRGYRRITVPLKVSSFKQDFFLFFPLLLVWGVKLSSYLETILIVTEAV